MLKGENLFCVTPELRLWISLIHEKKFPPNKKKPNNIKGCMQSRRHVTGNILSYKNNSLKS